MKTSEKLNNLAESGDLPLTSLHGDLHDLAKEVAKLEETLSKGLNLVAIPPESIYTMHAETSLMYRFKDAPVYMMNYARSVQLHKFAEAMAECYLVPDP